MKKKLTLPSFLIYTYFFLLSTAFILPVILVVSISLTDEEAIMKDGYSFIPQKFTTAAYEFIFSNPEKIINSYGITILTSVIGATVAIIIMMMCAYVLARKGFKYKNILSFYLFFTMIFGGGIVPKYIVVTQLLGLKNTVWILMLNILVNVWFIFILRAFIMDISDAIFESAVIDGASEFKVFSAIVMPLSKPALATFGLFMILAYWNEWMTALLYIDDSNLYPLQYLLQKTLQDLQAILQSMDKLPPGAGAAYDVPSETVRMAMAVVTTGPMLFIMPFFQKYFVRGMQLGSVKG